MTCQGIVTDVDSTFLFFKLDNKITVHMSILLTQNPSRKLPRVGSKVVVKNAHYLGATYSVCENSTLEGEFTVTYNKGLFFDMVKESKLGFHDLYSVEDIIEELEINYAVIARNVRTNIIQETLKCIINRLEKVTSEKHVCLNKHNSWVDLVTVNSCRYIEAQPAIAEKFSDFPHWSFGVHTKSNKNKLLFSFLHICPFYGFLMLSDDYQKVPCIITNATTDQIASIDRTYIFIKEYRVLTEIYQERNVPNVEYFLIDFNDIEIIYRRKKDDCLFGKTIPPQKTFKISLHFKILRKSTVCVGNTGNRETWLQVLIKNEGTGSNEVYLILTSHYIDIVIYLEEGHHYKLFYNNTLKEIQNVELTRLKKLKIHQLQDEDAFFLKLDEVVAPKNYLTVEECKKYVSNHTELVSFEGVLKAKKFGTLLPSRTIKRTKAYGFGTPGSKGHQLVFSYEEDNKVVYLDCYLNNWENFEMPLGLIPQMKIIVRNVIPQSKKYVKSSVFTTFEIVGYEPLLQFDTVNLYKDDDLYWGRKSFLGQGNKIPYGVLLWGKVGNIQILSIKFNTLCAKCNFNVESSGLCNRCQSTESTTDFLVKMHVSDEFGQSKILAKFPGIMKVFLNIQDNQFKTWLSAFTQLGQYEYNMFEEVTITDTVPEHCIFKRTLSEYISVFNKYGILFLNLKCRKLESSMARNGGRPLWLCVAARRC